jgi:Lytic transglycolase
VGNIDWFDQNWSVQRSGRDLRRPNPPINPKLLAQSPGLLGIIYAGQAPLDAPPASAGGGNPLLKVSEPVAAPADPSTRVSRPTPTSTPIRYTGEASYYPDDRGKTASGIRFNPNLMTGAMSPARVSQKRLERRPPPMAVVSYLRPGSKTPTKIKIPIIDHGPWLLDPNRRGHIKIDPETRKGIPHPTRIIDLSPAAFRALTGKKAQGILKNVTVEMVPDEPMVKP